MRSATRLLILALLGLLLLSGSYLVKANKEDDIEEYDDEELEVEEEVDGPHGHVPSEEEQRQLAMISQLMSMVSEECQQELSAVMASPPDDGQKQLSDSCKSELQGAI